MENEPHYEAIISLSSSTASVDFSGGIWTKMMVEKAYRCMLNSLPAYIAKMRADDQVSEPPKKIERKAK